MASFKYVVVCSLIMMMIVHTYAEEKVHERVHKRAEQSHEPQQTSEPPIALLTRERDQHLSPQSTGSPTRGHEPRQTSQPTGSPTRVLRARANPNEVRQVRSGVDRSSGLKYHILPHITFNMSITGFNMSTISGNRTLPLSK